MLNLVQKIVEVELVLADFALQFERFLFVKLFLCFLHKADDVTHAEDAVCHSFGMENVKRFHLFARSDKENGLINHVTNGKGSTTAGVAVKFCQHNSFEVEAVVELFGGVHGVLSGHGINHEERVVGLNRSLDGGDFVHQFLIDGEASGGIDDDGVIAFRLGFVNAFKSNLDGVFFLAVHIHLHANLLTEHLELVNGGGTIDVAGDEQGFA